MKIRNGFVSNSSSSSFIITGESIFDVAKNMLNTYIDSFEIEYEDGENNALKLLENFEKAKKNSKIKNGKIGITFPSCNQDTYILTENHKIYVQTCNNHPWEIDARNVYDTDEGRDVEDIINSGMFYDLKRDVIHSGDKFTDKNETCKKCNRDIFSYYIMRNKAVCSECLSKLWDIKPVKPIKPIKVPIVNSALQYIEI